MGVDFFVVGDVELVKDDAADHDHRHDRGNDNGQEHVSGQRTVIPCMGAFILGHGTFH